MLPKMKVALVHELLTMRGGAEKVLEVLAEMFPEALIYTLLYDEKLFGKTFPPSRVRPSRLQSGSWLTKNHHWYLEYFPGAVEAWDFSEFDLVISSSSAFTHGILTNGKPKHLCYVQSPARYLWDRTHDVLNRAGKGPLGFVRKPMLSRLFHKLRIWDSEAAERPDVLIAPSKEIQRRIELYWRRESEVIYPPIEDFWFTPIPESRSLSPYFLIVSTLVPYKRIEFAIEACNQLKLPLIIAGDGPHRSALQKIAGPTIKFLGFQSQEKLKELYANATATIFPGDEDFGLVPLESMACGTPVIAFKSGGALETVNEKTGVFFEEPSWASLATVLKTFDASKFHPDTCRTHAEHFSQKKFEEKIRSAVSAIMK